MTRTVRWAWLLWTFAPGFATAPAQDIAQRSAPNRAQRSTQNSAHAAAHTAAPRAGQTAAFPALNDPANLAGERVSARALADDLPINRGDAALEQLLRKLRTRGSLMLIVAHPDDEDGGLLTFESRGAGARVAMLTLTRGEGGQNLMSGDFGDALGLIRTQELLEEDRFTGVDQMFGTEVDFGFSKTKEESFAKWTHARVLYDAVRAVRLYRPLVLASVFVGGPTDGHGQHQVSGEICQEVFKAAADPRVFPEMLKDGIRPWAPLKVYARVPFSRVSATGMYDYATGKTVPPHFVNYVTGAVSAMPPLATVTIHEGDQPNIPAFEGKSFVQFARQGLALQKTQIGHSERIPPAGRADVGYTLMGSRANGSGITVPHQGEQTLFDSIDVSLGGIADLAPSASARFRGDLRGRLRALDAKFAEAQHALAASDTAALADTLHDSLAGLDGLLHDVAAATPATLKPAEKADVLHELRIKRVELNDALALALRLTPEARLAGVAGSAGDPVLTTSPVIPVAAKLKNNSAFAQVTLVSGALSPVPNARAQSAAQPGSPLTPLASSDLTLRLTATGKLPATRPYFYRTGVEQAVYTLGDPALRGAPLTPDPLVAHWRVVFKGVPVELAAVVAGADAPALDPAGTDVSKTSASGKAQPAVIVPPASVSVVPRASILRTGQHQLAIVTGIESRLSTSGALQRQPPPIQGEVGLQPPPHWQSAPAEQRWRLNSPATMATSSFMVTPAGSPSTAGSTFQALATLDGNQYKEAFRAVGYPGLTYTNYFAAATARVVEVDVRTAPGLHIGYVAGTGDEVAAFLPQLGVTPTPLSVADLEAGKAQGYDAIVLGVRAYAAHPELAGAGSRALNAFARAGGVVVVQYNSGGFDASSAPYPYQLPGDPAHNVVEEADPVEVLAPAAPLLNWPNRLTAADFNGWVEERGHGFASTWAPEYQALLETHDPGQDPQRGGLLVAPVGRGAYVYCALALYRQLPEAVPGAYRLLANLLSYGKNPARQPAAGAGGASQ